MSILIGVTPRIFNDEKVEKQFVNTRYLAYLKEKNFDVVMLTVIDDGSCDVLNLCDGFLITGGYDIDPKYYHQENEGASENISKSLDKIDFQIIEYCVKKKKPLLGICRGLQVINVYFNGSLIQDNLGHRKLSSHLVKVFNSKYFIDQCLTTNSFHHQTIDILGNDLEAFAIASDGVIEGIYHNTLPIIAVQWHPEITLNDFDMQIIKLFKTFCLNYKTNN